MNGFWLFGLLSLLVWLVGWLVVFYGISTFVGYLMPKSFSYKQFYFKQLSLA